MNNPPTLVLRVDASRSLGLGHLVRSLALAEAWCEIGGKVHFVSRTDGTLAAEMLAEFSLEEPFPDRDDAIHVAKVVIEQEAEWVVLDGYTFDLAYETTLRRAGFHGKLCVIDDRIRPSSAELFVLPTSPLPEGTKIQPGPTRLLSGLNYALLRRDFRHGACSESPTARLLLVLGGTDAAGLTGEVAKILAGPAEDNGWEAVVMAPPTTILPPLPRVMRKDLSLDLAKEMTMSSLVVCSASTVALEACALGIPQVLLVVAENQKPVAKHLVASGSALVVSHLEDLGDAVKMALSQRTEMSLRAASLVDGLGALRVARTLMAMAPRFRRPDSCDIRLLFEWANEPAVRRASFQEHEILWESHLQWFEENRLDSSHCWMRIALDAASNPIGILRLKRKGELVWWLSFSLDAAYRGLGLGEAVLRMGCREFFKDHPSATIRAEVKPENTQSLRTFSRAGFQKLPPQTDREVFLKNDEL